MIDRKKELDKKIQKLGNFPLKLIKEIDRAHVQRLQDSCKSVEEEEASIRDKMLRINVKKAKKALELHVGF